ncbi:uncharacterized protein yc1106_04532 [Curvularia clavata]|uniref:Uncharacterized protein n=1 Tax=Curvularia clavata TaxID=95742 RepID=A0A9Q9DRA0_CURCL|nr:uncharacterized protein yc1106_04532 [Curvularia clavata]
MPLCFLARQARPKSSTQPFIVPAFKLNTGSPHKGHTPTVKYNRTMDCTLLSRPLQLMEHDIMDILKWLDETEQSQVPQDTCRRKHSRKQPKSDSSLLEPLCLQASSAQQEAKNRNAGEISVASPSDSSSSSRYVRKSRRKTRPERYDPNSPKGSRQKNNSSKARHKSRQKKGQGPSQLVQSYKAQNVSGDRLTLRPPKLGLFNKGRTSTAARGRGLPDLVFSEMKFLQKHDESTPPPQSEVPKKKREKDHTHTKDEEISSFFTSRHDPLRKDSEDKQSRHSSIGEDKRHYSDRHGHTKPEIDRDEGLPKPSGLPPVAKKTTDSANGRFQVPSLALSHSRVSRSQSCPQYSSSPRRVNLVDRSERLQHTEKACSSSSMPPTMPRILSVNSDRGLSANCSIKAESRTPQGLEREAHPTSQRHSLYNSREDYVREVEASSDFGRVLQVCEESIHNRHLAAPSRRQDINGLGSLYPTQSVIRQHRTNSHTSTQRIPTVRFAELPYQYPAQSTLAGPGIYERQEQHQHATWEVPETRDLDDYLRALEEDYMDEGRALLYDDEGDEWDGTGGMDNMPEASMLYEHEDDKETGMAGSVFLVDNVSEDPRPGNDVVTPRFWRPNKLY